MIPCSFEEVDAIVPDEPEDKDPELPISVTVPSEKTVVVTVGDTVVSEEPMEGVGVPFQTISKPVSSVVARV